MSIQISNIEIRQDSEGRYSLTDIHKAAMLSGKATVNQRPGDFLRLGATQRLVQEACRTQTQDPVRSTKGGAHPGTYAEEFIAFKYAGWLHSSLQADLQIAIYGKGEPTDSLQVSDPTDADELTHAKVTMTVIGKTLDILRDVLHVDPVDLAECALYLVEDNFNIDLEAARGFLHVRT